MYTLARKITAIAVSMLKEFKPLLPDCPPDGHPLPRQIYLAYLFVTVCFCHSLAQAFLNPIISFYTSRYIDPNVDAMLDQCRRRWSNITPTLGSIARVCWSLPLE